MQGDCVVANEQLKAILLLNVTLDSKRQARDRCCFGAQKQLFECFIFKRIQYGSLHQKLGQIYCKPKSEIDVHGVAAAGLSTPALRTWGNANLTPGCSEGVCLGIEDSKSQC